MELANDKPRNLSNDEEMLVQDVRIAVGEYEAHCVRCVLRGSIPQLPFDARKNELIRGFATSRNVRL